MHEGALLLAADHTPLVEYDLSVQMISRFGGLYCRASTVCCFYVKPNGFITERFYPNADRHVSAIQYRM